MRHAIKFAHIDFQASAPPNGVTAADAKMLGVTLRDTHMLKLR